MNRLSLVLLSLLVSSSPSWGCLGPYRSLDWQVVESELIVLGEVIASGPLEDGEQEWYSHFQGVRAIVEVKVERTLKGKTPDGTIRVRTGPLRSCEPVGSLFAALYLDDRRVFLLPGPPSEGVYGLTWDGSVLPASHADDIVARIERAVKSRDDYLDDLRRNRPQALTHARKLHQGLTALSADWPPGEEQPWDEVLDQAVTATSYFTVEEISAATVFDLSDGLVRSWSRLPAWSEFIECKVLETRIPETIAFDECVLRRRLLDLEFSEAEIKAYMGARSRDQFEMFGYPFCDLSWVPRNGSDDMTLDFLAHAQGYDRSALWARYEMFADLSKLDTARVSAALRALWATGDEDARHAARLVIRATRGTEFVDLMFESILAGSPRDWWWLENHADTTVLPERLHALVELAHSGGKHEVWVALAEGGCFNPASMKEALERLGAVESQGGDLTGPEADAICAFLDQALVGLGGAAPKERSAAAYRKQWEAAPNQRVR